MKQKEMLFFVGSLLSVFTLFGALKPPKPPSSPRSTRYCYDTQTKVQRSDVEIELEKPTLQKKKLAPITQPLSFAAREAIEKGKKEASEAALKAETVLQFMRTSNAQEQALKGRSTQPGKSASLVPPAKSKRLPQASSMPPSPTKPLPTIVTKPTKHGPKILTVRPKLVSTVPVREEQISQAPPDTPSPIAAQQLRAAAQEPHIPPATASAQVSPSAASANAQSVSSFSIEQNPDDQECCSCWARLSCAWMVCCNIWNAKG